MQQGCLHQRYHEHVHARQLAFPFGNGGARISLECFDCGGIHFKACRLEPAQSQELGWVKSDAPLHPGAFALEVLAEFDPLVYYLLLSLPILQIPALTFLNSSFKSGPTKP